MNTDQAVRTLTKCYQARMPVLLKGAPGVGKSDVIEQVANNLSFDLIISHPVVADPTDAKGLPFPDKKGEFAKFLPYGDLAKALSAKVPTVWFLDDLGQATPQVQAAYMQLLLKRQIGEHFIPDCVTFAAATNRKQDRAGVSGLLEPVKSRFATIIELQPDINNWLVWALSKRLAPEVTGFLRFRPDSLLAHAPTTEMVNGPSPRTWYNLSLLVDLELDRDCELEAYSGAVGASTAQEFFEFIEVWRELPNPEAVLLDPQRAAIPEKISALHALTSALAHMATPENFSRICAYAARLSDAGQGEFGGYLLRDSTRRNPAVCQTAAYVTALSGPLGELFK